LCRGAKTAWHALGQVDYGRKSSEQGNAQFRRSLYFTKALACGAKIQAEDIRSVRPGFGLPPKFMNQMMGRTLTRDVKAATPVLACDLNEVKS